MTKIVALKRIECIFDGIESSNCYCSKEAAATIRKNIASIPVGAVHNIGTGDWHYVSLFWLERIEEPFSLVLFDNHPDDQDGAFDAGLLSCGNWVRHARALPLCREVLWNPSGEVQPLEAVYFSVDLDVLSATFAHTNWSQGNMSLDTLCSRISGIAKRCKVLGMDICGGLAESKGGTPEDAVLNALAADAVASCLQA